MKAHVRNNAPKRFDIDFDRFRLKTVEEMEKEKYGMTKKKFIQAMQELDPYDFMSAKKSKKSPKPSIKQF